MNTFLARYSADINMFSNIRLVINLRVFLCGALLIYLLFLTVCTFGATPWALNMLFLWNLKPPNVCFSEGAQEYMRATWSIPATLPGRKLISLNTTLRFAPREAIHLTPSGGLRELTFNYAEGVDGFLILSSFKDIIKGQWHWRLVQNMFVPWTFLRVSGQFLNCLLWGQRPRQENLVHYKSLFEGNQK